MNTAFKVKDDPKNNTKNKMILKILTAQKNEYHLRNEGDPQNE